MEVDDIQLSQELKSLLIAVAKRGIVTVDMIQTLANNLNNIDGSQVPQLPVYADGTLLRNVVRRGRITILNVASLTSLGQDSFNEFDFIETPKDNDIFLLRQNTSGQNITVSFSSAVNFTGKTTSDFTIHGEYIAFIYNQRDGLLHELYRSGSHGTALVNRYSVVTASGTTLDFPDDVTYGGIQSERTAATSATATWQVTAVGLNATASLYYDDGINGQILLGSDSWAGAPLATTVITDIKNAINALTATHGFTATDDGVDTVTVSADPNLGATANGWLFYDSLTNGMTSNIAVPNFAGGVDGTDQNETINTISGIGDGAVFIMENIMSAKYFKFVSGGNITTSEDIYLFPGEILLALVTDSSTIKLFSCCKKQLTNFRVVDPAGIAGFALKNWSHPFKTITEALEDGDGIEGIIHILPSSNYDERDIGNSTDARFQSLILHPGATIEYQNATNGYIFGGTTPPNRVIGMGDMNISPISSVKLNDLGSQSLIHYEDTTGNASNIAIDHSAGTTLYENLYISKDGVGNASAPVIKVSGGFVKFKNCTIEMDAAADCEAVKITGGNCFFENCTLIQDDASTKPVIDFSDGVLVLKDCLIYNTVSGANAHGILHSGAATTGLIYFYGINRIVTSHAASLSISSANNQNVKKMGSIYTTHATGGGGVLTDMITGLVLAVTTDADVE